MQTSQTTMANKQKRACTNPNPKGGDSVFPFIMATLVALLMLWVLWSAKDQLNKLLVIPTIILTTTSNTVLDPPEKTFYDDPNLSYSIDKPLKHWDEKRSEWLRLHSRFVVRDSILLVTGSQPSPCNNPFGDHLLLRCFKNKVDYCRIHGCEVYYNNLHLHPKMDSYWAKLPVLKSIMMAHPEVEWIWWMDSDAIFTDMEFNLPMERYKDHNLVVHGWSHMVYAEKNNSWFALNSGSVLFRNCQWSIDLLDKWAHMGPISPNYKKWGKVLQSTFIDQKNPLPDDQTALIYLLLKEREKWGPKTYLEEGYNLEGYWLAMLGKYEGIIDGYDKLEEGVKVLRRRHAEKVSLWYGELRETYLKELGWEPLSKERRPFVTHFTGCQPCSGNHNPIYEGNICWEEMERALNFADNQVIRNYGFVRKDLTSKSVCEVSFDYPRRDHGSLLC